MKLSAIDAPLGSRN